MRTEEEIAILNILRRSTRSTGPAEWLQIDEDKFIAEVRKYVAEAPRPGPLEKAPLCYDPKTGLIDPPHWDPDRCHSHSDGDCYWKQCPQLRDGEPAATGRHCPLDKRDLGES